MNANLVYADIRSADLIQYLKEKYPVTVSNLHGFSPIQSHHLASMLESLGENEHITIHAFPGMSIGKNAYLFPRFLRISKHGGSFQIFRESSQKERVPGQVSREQVQAYYAELVDLSYLIAQKELRWQSNFHMSTRTVP
jgi:hypothetical protein